MLLVMYSFYASHTPKKHLEQLYAVLELQLKVNYKTWCRFPALLTRGDKKDRLLSQKRPNKVTKLTLINQKTRRHQTVSSAYITRQYTVKMKVLPQ